MYDFFRGRVHQLDQGGNLSLEVAGVGYRLRISEQTRRRLPLDGSECVVQARLVVREDDLLLFGFADVAERAAFDLLTGVQGIGPGHALAILSAFTVEALVGILVRAEVKELKSVKGIGVKTAERIVLELRGKTERIPLSQLSPAERAAQPAAAARDEARQALIALGFGAKDVEAALDKIAAVGSAEELVRAALGALR